MQEHIKKLANQALSASNQDDRISAITQLGEAGIEAIPALMQIHRETKEVNRVIKLFQGRNSVSLTTKEAKALHESATVHLGILAQGQDYSHQIFIDESVPPERKFPLLLDLIEEEEKARNPVVRTVRSMTKNLQDQSTIELVSNYIGKLRAEIEKSNLPKRTQIVAGIDAMIEFLPEAERLQEISRTALRASVTASQDPDQHLRAVTSARSVTPENQLLRASEKSEPETATTTTATPETTETTTPEPNTGEIAAKYNKKQSPDENTLNRRGR